MYLGYDLPSTYLSFPSLTSRRVLETSLERNEPCQVSRRAHHERSILIEEILQFAHRLVEAKFPAKGTYQFRWSPKGIMG